MALKGLSGLSGLSPPVIARCEAPWQSHSKALHVGIAALPEGARNDRQDKLKGKTTLCWQDKEIS